MSAVVTETERAKRVLGAPIRRKEDRRLVTGHGRYTSDLLPPDCLHAVFLRSPVPHARLAGLDASAALELPGVVGVWTAGDVAALGARDIPIAWITPGQRIEATPLLARDKVYFAGQQIALIVATDPYLAEDAAELIRLDLEPLPIVVDTESALADDATLLHEGWGTNVVAAITSGGGAVDEAFDAAPVTVGRRLDFQRVAACPMEGRGVVAEYDPADGRVTAHVSTQGAHAAREVITTVCGWRDDDLRVICPDVGGGFGTKEYPYAEDALICLIARQLKRPVKWLEDRREGFLSSVQAREMKLDVELAADAEGRVLAVRGGIDYDVGGYPSGQGIGPARFGADVFPGPYAIDACRLEVRGVVTNKAPVGAFRGYGAPQVCFAIERLLDALAAELGIDGVELRRRNLLSADQLPHRMPSGFGLDSGDYPAAYERVLEELDLDGFRERQREERERGRLLGAAIVPYVMGGGLTNSKILGLSGQAHGAFETVQLRMDAGAGVVLYLGSSSQGQGHETALAQVAAESLGLEAGEVRVVGGDTDVTPFTPASALASRTAPVVGAIVSLAAERLAAKLRRLAAHQLGCEPEEVELSEGQAVNRDSPEQRVPLTEVAHGAHTAFDLPEGEEPALEVVVTLDPPDGTFGFGVHAAIVEVDPQTGAVQIERYLSYDDCGTRLNPVIVEGQIIGGIAQGIGGALFEDLRYDPDSGQPVTTSFLDYLLPTADQMPAVELFAGETPAPHLPIGAKGVGEAGTIPPAALLTTAVEDAVRAPRRTLEALPLTPERVLALVDDAAAG